ncbi:spindle assembly abnormal protein 6 homolog [Anguilla anguilla]|uniref:spindle assembly abnormal protein 6 homolog n=1 Tax=Anguilla anguilla TaxID=7936 RepID=UPI0015ADE93F|nr:spindle assembly abnormal protein 6 homolog [Anguilla anguilla]XP_035268530.1 spindle assembly abnormal protein 6 homolog [Anguilla anguilla]
MTETLFNKSLQVQVKCKDCEDRRTSVRVIIELLLTTSPIHKRDLVVRLTDDSDPYFLYNLAISEEDFQSLKVQQGLLVDFSAFPQKFIDLLNQCISEQDKDYPRFLLQLSSPSSVLDHSPASLNIVETNAFKHLTHLSLKLLHGTDLEIKKYLAVCLSCVKEEKRLLEQKLKRTEEDLTRQLSYTQQTLAEKSRELDRLRSEWASHTTALSNQHCQELTAEREKALEIQTKLQHQGEQLRREVESAHVQSTQQLQSRLAELESSSRELTEHKYKSESAIRDLKAKLAGLEEEAHRAKQQVQSLRRENGTLDSECHDKDRQLNQLQTRVAVLEQEIKDKDQLVLRTKEVLEATQEQKHSVEGSAENKQVQIGRLEATVKSLSEELIKANGIIKKLQSEAKALVGKIKVKNSVTVSQEKLLQETSERLGREQKELQDTRQQLRSREEEVAKLQEQLEATVQKLDESREVLKTNENVITWLNKQLNENQLMRKQEALGAVETPPAVPSAAGLRMGNPSLNMGLDNRSFPSGMGQGYPVTSTLNSKLSFPLSCVSSAGRPVFALHNQGPGPKVQFNPMSAKPGLSPVEARDGSPSEQHARASNKENGEPQGLESKYFERREDSIALRGLLPNMHFNREISKTSQNAAAPPARPGLHSAPSAYFPG